MDRESPRQERRPAAAIRLPANLATTLLALWAATAAVLADGGEGVSTEGPVLLFVHGRLAEGGETAYQQYLRGTQPLIARWGAEVTAVGAAISSEHTDGSWPINAVLRFPDRASAEGFLSDPDYLHIRQQYRDRAYEELHLTLVQDRPPRLRTPKQVAEETFGHFRRGLAAGDWAPFLGMLHDDVRFRFPTGPWQGNHRGKAKMAEFLAYVSAAFPQGLRVREVERITAEGETVVFEFGDEGSLRGKPYRNLVAISLDVCGDKVCSYREYFGLVGPPPSSTAAKDRQ